MTSKPNMRAFIRSISLRSNSSIHSLRGLVCNSHGRGRTGAVPTGNASRRKGLGKVSDIIACLALFVIGYVMVVCAGVLS
ncbi:hypothetical protein JQX09_24310 [Sulfitobacter pseudonitzschiae]|uniref:Uncharacterized protein n=1 Tax=Pseudosulfitobacter pseudonitzschiae TaxID=1402135 RepID=A0A9Q2NYU9_9RHOB|nr:hypothetical protein [Pseudosulfitobacter pseudonitzschiae]MBM2295047.1 hypothetical protein [Pseudosulfitobacter pseudonitzschiae]MBM2299961.1 hypothetical protein [Pseudosulfitobacter pseudonitzschiae]MBM2304885.1 hypothetical protein [Pseudosulfitobacter pseudonitzschiae]MBM2314658.1 hypothetical protein [Pseudosulfitobacter pseudonitzschiae]MBM2319568.1 hypothetical protein [Pseudosulfitobacter pseudonitzschiae]